jgi:CheY-like chemotaxis protein
MPPLLALHTGSSSMNERDALQVLIVDDSVLIQKMMKKWLEANGCIVSCAINGKIGLDMIKTKQYDIMLLDFLMVSHAFVFCCWMCCLSVICVCMCVCVCVCLQPVMLGLDALEQFTKWKTTASGNADVSLNNNMLVIGMSSTANEDEQRRGFEHGMHFFSPKPVELESLKRTLMYKRAHRYNVEECMDTICDDVMVSRTTARQPSFRDDAPSPAKPQPQPQAQPQASTGGEGTSQTATSGKATATGTETNERVPAVTSTKAKSSGKVFGNWSFRKHAKVSPM